MDTVAGFPFFPVEFNKEGGVVQRAQVDALLDYLKQQQTAGQPVTDLLVVSHGWDTDIPGAWADYNAWLGCARAVLDGGQPPALAGRTLVGLGVFWPSKKFADASVTPGGAAGIDAPSPQQLLLAAQLDNLSAAMTTPASTALLEQAKALLPDLEDQETARRQFADLVRNALQRDPVAGNGQASDDDATVFYSLDGADLFNRLQTPDTPTVTAGNSPDVGGATDLGAADTDISDTTGAAAGIGDFVGKLIGGVEAAAGSLLNLATFYLMKDRAGIVGRTGVYSTLREVAAAEPTVTLHLLGHSFGARLVTAVALGPAGGASLPVGSLTLLQAAYSQNGLGVNFDGNGHDGYFRDVIARKRVSGPIAITFSSHDETNGIAYPLAVRVSGDNSSGLGDATDLYGAMGRNGAQHTPEATAMTMQPVGGAYGFAAGGVYNLDGQAYIKGHTDIAHNEVAYAFLSAIAIGIVQSPEDNRNRLLSNMETSVVAVPLLRKIQSIRESQTRGFTPDADILDVIIDVNLMYAGLNPEETAPDAPLMEADSSRDRAKFRVRQLLHDILAEHNRPGLGIYERKSRLSHQYLFARLDIDSILELVRRDETMAVQKSNATAAPTAAAPATGSPFPMMTTRTLPAQRAVYRIWEDFRIEAALTQSISTVKANAAHVSYGALGKDIVWAVMDSGIDGSHRHFAAYANLEAPSPLRHTDFTGMSDTPNATPREVPVIQSSRQEEEAIARAALTDTYGHGTHVAGIIAGTLPIPENLKKKRRPLWEASFPKRTGTLQSMWC